MKRSMAVAGLLAGSLLLGGVALGQQPPHPGPGQPPPGRQEGAPPHGGMPGGMGAGTMRGRMGMIGGAGGGGHPGLCQTLVGTSMPTEPKALAQTLQLCGEMLKAIGEVMLRHAQRLEAAR
jgi:hypothetical protein